MNLNALPTLSIWLNRCSLAGPTSITYCLNTFSAGSNPRAVVQLLKIKQSLLIKAIKRSQLIRWETSLRGKIVNHRSQQKTPEQRRSISQRPHMTRGHVWQLCSGQLAERGYPFNISYHLQRASAGTNVETDKQAVGPSLIFFMTVARKCGLYLHIDSISQMDNLCCLWFALEEEWGVKAAVKAGTPLSNAVWAAGRPWGAACLTLCLRLSVPLTDGPHSTTVYLTLPCSLSAVKCNVITPLYNQNSNYSTGASARILKGAFLQLCECDTAQDQVLLGSFHSHCSICLLNGAYFGGWNKI